jgi:antitoxin ParD1/3/4
MNIDLTPELEEFVRQELASGRYGSASEVVCEALRRMQERDRLSGAKLDHLREDIRDGERSGPAGSWDAEEIKRVGRARRAAGNAEADI